MWSFLFISNHLQASGWELAKLNGPLGCLGRRNALLGRPYATAAVRFSHRQR